MDGSVQQGNSAAGPVRRPWPSHCRLQMPFGWGSRGKVGGAGPQALPPEGDERGGTVLAAHAALSVGMPPYSGWGNPFYGVTHTHTHTHTHTLLSKNPFSTHHACTQNRHSGYRTNPKDSRNPNFRVGCFELIMSKIVATASKMGKRYFIFAIFLCGTHICVGHDAKN